MKDINTVFAIVGKASINGFAKTRLEKDVGSEVAQSLYCSFIKDFFNNLQEYKNLYMEELFLYVTPKSQDSINFFNTMVPEELLPYINYGFQENEPFFKRLETLFKLHKNKFIHLTGTDIPDFPFQFLDTVVDPDKVYIGEDEDGGFYYLGSKAKNYKLFDFEENENVYYSITRKACTLGLQVVELPKWSDIDDLLDLEKSTNRSCKTLLNETIKTCKTENIRSLKSGELLVP